MSAFASALTETTPVVTPRDRSNPASRHNFGPCSFRDSTLYTAERPGHRAGEPNADVSSDIVRDWSEFMLAKGIRHALIIMEDDEFDVYDVDLVEFYAGAGLIVHRIPYSSEDAHGRTMALIDAARARGEKLVTHCTGGKGRCGRVACAWLCRNLGLSPLEASREFLDVAAARGLYRLGDVKKLEAWMKYKTC